MKEKIAEYPTETPNVGIEDPDTRRSLAKTLFFITVLTGIASLFFQFFPEAALGTDLPTRAIAFINAAVSLLSGSFGLSVLVPNIPSNRRG